MPAARRRRDTPPPHTGPTEKEVLLGFLTYLRDCVIAKLDDAPEPAVREPGVPSGTNLLGLVRHLSFVERFRFLGATVSSWPATFRPTRRDTVESVVAGYRAAIESADEVIRSCSNLADPAPTPGGRNETPSMRWALTLMIQETARHAGHMDILREQLDGRTGR